MEKRYARRGSNGYSEAYFYFYSVSDCHLVLVFKSTGVSAQVRFWVGLEVEQELRVMVTQRGFPGLLVSLRVSGIGQSLGTL